MGFPPVMTSASFIGWFLEAPWSDVVSKYLRKRKRKQKNENEAGEATYGGRFALAGSSAFVFIFVLVSVSIYVKTVNFLQYLSLQVLGAAIII